MPPVRSQVPSLTHLELILQRSLVSADFSFRHGLHLFPYPLNVGKLDSRDAIHFISLCEERRGAVKVMGKETKGAGPGICMQVHNYRTKTHHSHESITNKFFCIFLELFGEVFESGALLKDDQRLLWVIPFIAHRAPGGRDKRSRLYTHTLLVCAPHLPFCFIRVISHSFYSLDNFF